jgi:hypothetical protein
MVEHERAQFLKSTIAASVDPSLAFDIILGIGGELWTKTVIGARCAERWRFCVISIDQSPVLLAEEDWAGPPEVRRVSDWVESFEVALLLLGGKWHEAFVLAIHPDFRPRVWPLVLTLSRFQQVQGPVRRLGRWREYCGVADQGS